jgi:hypothetical protein
MSKIVCFIILFEENFTKLVFLFTISFSISFSLLFTADIVLVVSFEGVLRSTHPFTITGISDAANKTSLFLGIIVLWEKDFLANCSCVITEDLWDFFLVVLVFFAGSLSRLCNTYLKSVCGSYYCWWGFILARWIPFTLVRSYMSPIFISWRWVILWFFDSSMQITCITQRILKHIFPE